MMNFEKLNLEGGAASPIAVNYDAIASFYDDLVGVAATKEWTQGICALMKGTWVRNGNAVDLCCGTGIGGSTLARIGTFELTGIDLSHRMLDEARMRRGHAYERLVHGDIRALPSDLGMFDVACLGFDSINYFTPGELGAVLTGIAKHLVPGGIFAFDCFEVGPSFAPVRSETEIGRLRGARSGRSVKFVATFEAEAITTEMLISANETQTVRLRMRQWRFERKTLTDALRQAGLSVVAERKLVIRDSAQKTAYLARRDLGV